MTSLTFDRYNPRYTAIVMGGVQPGEVWIDYVRQEFTTAAGGQQVARQQAQLGSHLP